MPTLYWCPHHVLKATGAPVYISRNSQATLGCNQNKMLAVPEYFFLGLDPKLLMLESRLVYNGHFWKMLFQKFLGQISILNNNGFP